MQTSKKSINPWAWIPTLYFAEGIPYVVVMAIAVVMYKRLGLSNTDIALYTSWLYLPWVIKPFWSPIVDMLRTKRWWILVMQLLVGASMAGVAFTIPTQGFVQWTLCFFWLMAFSSATHDIAADGFYMLAQSQSSQAAFVGVRSTFYRLANVFGNGVIVAVAGFLESHYGNIPMAWRITVCGSAVLLTLLTIYHIFMIPRPAADVPNITSDSGNAAGEIFKGFGKTVSTFFKKPGVWLAIVFMLCYRLPEAFLIKMCTPFLVAARELGGLGMKTEEVGLAYGTIGVIFLLLGGILGGLLASRIGLKKSLWPMAACMTLPCLSFVYLAIVQPTNLLTISACIAIEQFGYGFGFTAYMLYMMYFSEGQFKTSHYAFCTCFMALSMMIPGMFAGYIQETLGYRDFFWMVIVCCIVTVAVTTMAYKKVSPEYGMKKTTD